MAVELVTFIVENLVSEPDKLVIGAQEEDGTLNIEIRCAPDDAGRVIGRGGRIINSIRTLARAASDGRGRIEVHLID